MYDYDNNNHPLWLSKGMFLFCLYWNTIFWVIFALIITLITIFSSGCAGIRHTTEAPKTAQVLGFGGWGGTAGGMSSVIVHKYDYQVRPPALAPGTPATPPWLPPAVDYPTIYQLAWDDPSLVIFKNDSYRRVRIEIDDKKSIVLGPYGATSNLHLGIGDHPVRITIEKPTANHGAWEMVRFLKVYIRPEGRSQIFHIYDY